MAKRKLCPPPQQNPATNSLPFVEEFQRVIRHGVEVRSDLVRIQMAHRLNRLFWVKDVLRPPFGPMPESKSGATAI